MAGYLFFRTSRSAFRQVTELFDFVTPTAVALWNLRWQVAGFYVIQPTATVEMLDGRFLSGSGLRGANFRRACIDTTWEEQQTQFAKFLLVNLFSIYEGWLSDVIRIVAPAGRRAALVKRCQFPNISNGIAGAIDEIRTANSPMLTGAFYTALRAQRKNSLPQIGALLTCYRCFKEGRNSFAHNNAVATQTAVDAYNSYLALSASDLGVSEKPKVDPVILNKPISFSLRGVVGFTDIILRIIATLDAEFSCSLLAELEFRAQWTEHFTINGKAKRITLKSAGVGRREKHLARLVHKLRLPVPLQTHLIDKYLKQHRLVN